MASGSGSRSDWWKQPPSAFDIVTAYFPESNPKGAIELRPCLVLDVFESEDGEYACRVAYGTKNIKFVQRKGLDLIIQNAADLDTLGLPYATRFALDEDCQAYLTWDEEFFGAWRGYPTPMISFLPEEYQKEFAYIMMLRSARENL
jgi:hypothetical protein